MILYWTPDGRGGVESRCLLQRGGVVVGTVWAKVRLLGMRGQTRLIVSVDGKGMGEVRTTSDGQERAERRLRQIEAALSGESTTFNRG